MAEWDVEATRHTVLRAEIERVGATAQAKTPSTAVRLTNLQSELADIEKTMSQLANGAEAARRRGTMNSRVLTRHGSAQANA
jgi:hypothetical protein